VEATAKKLEQIRQGGKGLTAEDSAGKLHPKGTSKTIKIFMVGKELARKKPPTECCAGGHDSAGSVCL